MSALPQNHTNLFRLTNELLFTHPLQEQQSKKIIKVAEEIAEKIIGTNEGPFLIQGVMGAGKTTTLKLIANKLGRETKNIVIYRLNDNRASEGDIYDRNNTELISGTEVHTFEFQQGIENIISDIEQSNLSNMVMFISEAQFGGTKDQLKRLKEIAIFRNIVLVFDCLDRLYNGLKIGETQFIARSLCSNEDVYTLNPCDSFDENGLGNIPARFVALDEKGKLVDRLDIDKSHYYVALSDSQRQEIVDNFKKNLDNPLFQKLVTMRDGKKVYLVPSHPTLDESFIPGGNERYKSTNLITVLRILALLRLNSVAEEYKLTYNTEPYIES